MSNWFFTLLFLFSTTILVAQDHQPNPKNWIVGSSFSIFSSQSKTEGETTFLTGPFEPIDESAQNFQLAFLPYFGKQVHPNWILGVQLRYIIERFSGETLNGANGTLFENNLNGNGYGLGIFSRYIFNPNNKFQVFLNPTLFYQYDLTRQDPNESLVFRLTRNTIQLETNIGVQFQVSNTFRLLMTTNLFYYNLITSDMTSNSGSRTTELSNSTLTLSSDLLRTTSFALGFEFLF